MNDQQVMSEIEAEHIKCRCRSANWEEIKQTFPQFWSFIERLPESHNNGETVKEAFFPEIYDDLCKSAKNHLQKEMIIWKDILTYSHG